MNDQTRAFAKRFQAQDKGIYPTMVHAGVYSSLLHYFKAVEALKSDDGTKVIAKMKEMPTDDPLFGKGSVRADGRKIHPAYLVAGEDAGGIEVPVGLLQDRRDDPGRSGVPPDRPGRLPARQEVTGTVSVEPLSPCCAPRQSAPRQRPGRTSPCEIFGISTQALFGQLLIGLINGSFYALLSLGLAVIFGLLNIINFTHGAQYMMGAFCAWFLLTIARPRLLVGAPDCAGRDRGSSASIIERTMLARLYKLDHLYGLLLTFGLALIIQGLFRNEFGSSGLPYQIPPELAGGINLGFMFLPKYRAWVIVASLLVCLATWYVIERTKLGVVPARGDRESARWSRRSASTCRG